MNGIRIDDIGNGTFSANGGTLSGQTDAAVSINSGSGNVTYPGTIGNGPGLSARITNRTGGTVTFSGNINDTSDPGGGILMSGNSGGSTTFSGSTKQLGTGSSNAVDLTFSGNHTVNFTNGGLDIDTTSGTGFQATTGNATGLVSVQGSGNTIDSTSGGTALAVNGPDITSSNLTLQKISSSGATNGILLQDTGTSGGVHVTGTGSAGTGGTITGSSGPGISLTNTKDVQLASMNVASGQDDGIRGSSVTGFALTGSSSISGNGNAVTEDGLDFTDLTGTVTLTGATVSGSGDDNVSVVNTSGTVNATFTGGTYSNTQNSATGGDGIFFEGQSSASVTVNVQNATFSNNRDDHVQVTTSGSNTVSEIVTINGTTMTNTVGNPGGGITLNPGGNATMAATVTNNTIQGASIEAITVDAPGSTSSPQPVYIDATIAGNTIGDPAVPRSGASTGNEMGVRSNGMAIVRALIEDNNIYQYVNLTGIHLVQNDGNGTLDVTAHGNTISNPGSDGVNSGQNGILVVTGGATASDAGITCLDVGHASTIGLKNALSGAGSEHGASQDIRIRQRDQSVIRMPGYGGASTDTVAVTSYLQPRNDGDGIPSVTAIASGVAGSGFVGGGLPCAQP